MKRAALVLAAVLPLTFAACNDSTGPGRISGNYTLQSVGGDPLPATSGTNQQITDGTLQLNANGTFSASITSRFVSSGATNRLDFGGTYTQNGNSLTLTFPDTDGFGTASVPATWDGNRQVTIVDNVGAWVYVK